MLLTVLDAAGTEQTLVAQGQSTLVDRSGTLPDTDWNVAAPANPLRSGFVLQNLGGDTMLVSDLPEADRTDDNAWAVAPGLYWPPPGYPPVTEAISVKGVAGDKWAAREF